MYPQWHKHNSSFPFIYVFFSFIAENQVTNSNVFHCYLGIRREYLSIL